MASSFLLDPERADRCAGGVPLGDADGAPTGMHCLNLEGQCRTFLMGLPADAMRDFSDRSRSHFFLYAWLDAERGWGAQVHYQPGGGDTGAKLSDSPGDAVEHFGDFRMSIHVLPEEVDLLKVMCCVRMKDDESNNTRTSVVCTGAVRLNNLFMGVEENVDLSSVFDMGTTTKLCIRATNSGDFANSKMSISPTEALPLPLIKFRPSLLWRMNELQDHLKETCDTLQLKMDKFKVEAPFRAQSFVEGRTRCLPLPSSCVPSPPSLPQWLLAFSLCLGTPAYVFAPVLTQRMSRRPVGSSPEPSSVTAPLTSCPS